MRPALTQLGQVTGGECGERGFAFLRQREFDLTAVFSGRLAAQEARILKPPHKLDGAVVPNDELSSERFDRRRLVVSPAANGEQGLMLLRRQADGFGFRRAEREKAAQRMAKGRKAAEILRL
jgi:hypothetical protein